MIGAAATPQQDIELRSFDACSICWDAKDINANDMLVKLTPCEHSYHESCLLPWQDSSAQNASLCPDCRTPTNIVSRLKKINTPEGETAIEALPIRVFIRQAANANTTNTQATRNPTRTALTTSALFLYSRTMTSLLTGALGSYMLKNTDLKTPAGTMTGNTFLGSILTAMPNAAAHGVAAYLNQASPQTAHTGARLNSIHVVSQVAVEALNSALGNQLLGNENISTKAAAATGATGYASLLALAGGVVLTVMTGLKVNAYLNRPQTQQPAETEQSARLLSADSPAVV